MVAVERRERPATSPAVGLAAPPRQSARGGGLTDVPPAAVTAGHALSASRSAVPAEQDVPARDRARPRRADRLQRPPAFGDRLLRKGATGGLYITRAAYLAARSFLAVPCGALPCRALPGVD